MVSVCVCVCVCVCARVGGGGLPLSPHPAFCPIIRAAVLSTSVLVLFLQYIITLSRGTHSTALDLQQQQQQAITEVKNNGYNLNTAIKAVALC